MSLYNIQPKWYPNLRREKAATVYVINPVTEEFLLLHHNKSGKWLSPGGHSENNESLKETALRHYCDN